MSQNNGLEWCPGADLNHRHADFQSNSFPEKSAPYKGSVRQTAHEGSKTYGEIVKPNTAEEELANENPGALAGATGANSKADELRCLEYAKPDPLATLARLRSQHLARVCGLTDCRAATIAALYFAGVAS